MSMISRSWSNIKNLLGSENVKQRGEVLGGILTSNASYGDHEALKALAPLVTALCSNNITGVSDVGLYIFYKIKNESGEYQIFFKRLTVAERAIIDKKPTLLKDPYNLLENIEAGLAIDQNFAEELRKIANGASVKGKRRPSD